MLGNGYIYKKGLGNLDEHSNAFYVRINSPSQLKIVQGERGWGRGGGESRLISLQEAARIELHGE